MVVRWAMVFRRPSRYTMEQPAPGRGRLVAPDTSEWRDLRHKHPPVPPPRPHNVQFMVSRCQIASNSDPLFASNRDPSLGAG